jgi:GMP synthase (glutamine-hydrolysing)
VLALQFHPDAEVRTFERWLIGHAAELGAAGISVPLLREQARTLGPALQQAARAVLTDWLQAITA